MKSDVVKIDKIDKKILHELTKNARQTTLDISKKIKQTERIVRYRIKRLEKEKIIQGYRVFLNTNLLGLKYYKLLIDLQDTKKEDINKMRSYIKEDSNVVYSTEALGGFDFELEVHLRDSQELMGFILDFKEKFPRFIKNITHMEYMKEYKLTYFPVSDI